MAGEMAPPATAAGDPAMPLGSGKGTRRGPRVGVGAQRGREELILCGALMPPA